MKNLDTKDWIILGIALGAIVAQLISERLL